MAALKLCRPARSEHRVAALAIRRQDPDPRVRAAHLMKTIALRLRQSLASS